VTQLRLYHCKPAVSGFELFFQFAIDFLQRANAESESCHDPFMREPLPMLQILAGGRRRPATISDYRKYLRADTGVYAEQEFRLWPASSDAEVPGQYLKLPNAMFAYGAWSMARVMSRAGEPAFLYRFTWSDAGKRAKLGACHGEELYFLSNRFPTD
jgi:hypothetical protein